MGGARYDNWTPTQNPVPDIDPRIAQYNYLGPVNVVGKVTDLAQFSAINQSGLTQLSQIRPATYTTPGTASTVIV